MDQAAMDRAAMFQQPPPWVWQRMQEENEQWAREHPRTHVACWVIAFIIFVIGRCNERKRRRIATPHDGEHEHQE